MAVDETNNVDDVTEVTEPTDVNTPANEPEEISWEQAMEWKKKAERADKAEKALVEKKRALKEAENKNKSAPTDLEGDSAFITKKELELERFIDKNPSLGEYKKELEEKLAKGLSLEEAKVLIENSPATLNRKKLERSGISLSDGGAPSKTSFTTSELESLPQKDYERVMRGIEDGKFTRVR